MPRFLCAKNVSLPNSLVCRHRGKRGFFVFGQKKHTKNLTTGAYVMFKKIWNLLAPFRRTFRTFVLLSFVYESVQIIDGYLISLVVRLFDMQTQMIVWAILLVVLLIHDELFLRLDNAYDWHIIAKQSHPIYKYLKLNAIAKFLRMDLTWHQRHNSGTSVGKVSDGVWKTLEIVDTMSWEFVPTIIQTTLSLIPLFLITPWVAVFSIIAFVLFMILTIKGNREKQPIRVRRHDLYQEEWRQAVESVQSVETNLAFGQQDRLIEDQTRLHDNIIAEAFKEHRLGIYKYNRWRIRILTVARRLILIVLVAQLYQGSLDVANLIFVSMLSEKLFSSFWRFARLLDRAAESSEGSLRLANLMAEPEPQDLGTKSIDTAGVVGISMENVCFAYGGTYTTNAGALHDFNLIVPPGSIVALVGPSGAGKTTIRKVITKLIDFQDGLVKVAGLNIRDWNGRQLLKLFSFVPQGDDVFIFDSDLKANIAFPRPNANDQQIQDAARLAGIHEFIIGLKDGYQTKVGERGVRLSGGQKQRLALARAILADRPILILDEATSAVDAITEKEIQTNMKTILRGKTAIIIAHRLSTVWDLADKIVVMDQGRKVEEGTHMELVALGGLYAKMVALQTA